MKIKPDIRDGLTFSGLLMLAGGLYLVYPPAALIVPGAVLIGLGLKGL